MQTLHCVSHYALQKSLLYIFIKWTHLAWNACNLSTAGDFCRFTDNANLSYPLLMFWQGPSRVAFVVGGHYCLQMSLKCLCTWTRVNTLIEEFVIQNVFPLTSQNLKNVVSSLCLMANLGSRKQVTGVKSECNWAVWLKKQRALCQMNVTAWKEHWLIRKPDYGSRERVAKGVCGGETF